MGGKKATVNTGNAVADQMNVPLGPYLNLGSGCYQMLERKLQEQSS